MLRYNPETPSIKRSLTNLSTGVVVVELFLYRGRLHRDPAEGPAEIRRSWKSGVVLYEMYKVNGKRHREDGPAEIDYDFQGRVIGEMYWLHNIRHRDPEAGPAERAFEYRNGKVIVTEENWYVNNECYRHPTDGPCSISRDPETGLEEHYFSRIEDAPPPLRSSQRRRPAPSSFEHL